MLLESRQNQIYERVLLLFTKFGFFLSKWGIMKIRKVINNNVITSQDTEGKEIVLMGKGIGFKKKENDVVGEECIEKIFRMDSQTSADQFKELLRELPLEYIQVSNQIIDYARQTLGKRMNQNVYITLTDHINFAVERHLQGMNFPNPFMWEVKRFYPSEYLIGEYAIRLVKEKLGVSLEEDEAASIALHLVNAEYNTRMNEAMKITTMIRDILDMVRNFLGRDLDEQSLYFSRFITHLKFLAQRAFTKEQLDSNDPKFQEIVSQSYPEEYVCSKQIGELIESKYDHSITSEELLYLTIHIKRIRKSTCKEE